MICYVDSSVVLSGLLNQSNHFSDWTKITYAFSSMLLQVECHRVLDRYRLLGELNDQELSDIKLNLQIFLRGITLYEISTKILERASEPFSTAVGTLDAIHLSTALLWRKENTLKQKSESSDPTDLLFLSYDEQLNTAVRACGINVI